MIDNDEVLRTIDGVFDGENMWGEDNRIYPVPSNYASKSKLIEGDTLRLYVHSRSGFVFKQINLIPRIKVLGTITHDYRVETDDNIYSILPSSIRYFQAEPGDEAVVVIPEAGTPTWAALENILKTNEHDISTT